MYFRPQSGQVVLASSPTSSPTWLRISPCTTSSSASFGGDSGSGSPAARAHGAHRCSSRRRPSMDSVRWTDASSWQRWHVMELDHHAQGAGSTSLLLLDRL